MIRPRVRAGLALAASLLLHASLVGVPGTARSPWESAAPRPALEVELQPLAPAAPIARAAPVRAVEARARPPARPPDRPATGSPPRDIAPVDPDPAAGDGARADASPPAEVAAADDTAAVGAAAEAPPQPPDPGAAEAPRLAAQVLPPRLELRYDARYGLASGKQSLLWVNEGERYTLSSVAEASGLAGVFYRGRFVQVSRGRLTAQGLQPEEFWDQRGERRSSARFDAAQLTLLPARGAPRHFSYSATPQDALSLFLQLALDAPAARGELGYTVFNGRKLRAYRYAPRGEVVLDTALGALRTLHLERVGDTDGRFEAWLAVDRHYLPVRLLRQDEDGNTIELLVQAIAP